MQSTPLPLWLPWVILAGGVGIPAIWAISAHNRFYRLRNQIRECWSGIDVELRRRYDLIPNLVETVRAHATHEREVLARLVEARERALKSQGDIGVQAQDEENLVIAANAVLARVEAYPQLLSSQSYARLQRELSLTEDRIAAARRFYNANVRSFNALLQSFPAAMIGRWLGMAPEPYFEIDRLEIRELPPLNLAPES